MTAGDFRASARSSVGRNSSASLIAERRRAERLRQRHEVGRPEVGPDLPPVFPQRQQPDEVVTAVAPDQVDRRQLQPHGGLQLHAGHQERAVARDRHDRLARPRQRRADRPGEADAHRLVAHAEEQPPRREAEEVPRRPDLVRTHVAGDRHVVADHLPQVVQDRGAGGPGLPPRLAPRDCSSRSCCLRLADQLGLVGRDRPEALRQGIDRAAEVTHQLDRRLVGAVDRRGDLIEVDHRRRRPEPLGRVVLDQVVADADDHVRLLEQPVGGLVVGVADAADEAVEQVARDHAVALEGAGHRQREPCEAGAGWPRSRRPRPPPRRARAPAGGPTEAARPRGRAPHPGAGRPRPGRMAARAQPATSARDTSDGTLTCTAPGRGRAATRNALASTSGIVLGSSIPTLHLVIGANSPTVSRFM